METPLCVPHGEPQPSDVMNARALHVTASEAALIAALRSLPIDEQAALLAQIAAAARAATIK
jgi:hypothetical protein